MAVTEQAPQNFTLYAPTKGFKIVRYKLKKKILGFSEKNILAD